MTQPVSGGSNSAMVGQLGTRPGGRAGMGNAAVAEGLGLSAPAPSSGQTSGQASGQAAAGPAWAQQPHIAGTLKEGAKGPDVEALQAALGIAVTGAFDAATKVAVVAFQKANKLGDDGVAGGKTLRKLGLRDDLRSRSHDAAKFVPEYRATAYSESDMYRTQADPYAVGAITKPNQEDDDGGKTYGTYQFESYVYKDGSKKSENAVSGSTVMRFVNWKDNPYGAELKAAAKGGVATEAFDAVWKDLTARENKAFGKAQELFLEHDVATKVTAFYDAAKVPASLRKDADLYDVAIGTVNQYGGLVTNMATALAEKIAAMKAPTADAVGAALQDIKAGRVTSQFKSSPNAWGGIRTRIAREKALFEN